MEINDKLMLAVQMLCSSEAARIFFMIPLTTASEKNVYVPLIDALAKRGHDVTVAAVKKSKYESKNVKEFVPLPNIEDFLGDFSSPVEGRSEGMMVWFTLSPESFEAPSCEKVYDNAEFQRAISENYDLVVVNSYFQYCFTPILPRIGTFHYGQLVSSVDWPSGSYWRSATSKFCAKSINPNDCGHELWTEDVEFSI